MLTVTCSGRLKLRTIDMDMFMERRCRKLVAPPVARGEAAAAPPRITSSIAGRKSFLQQPAHVLQTHVKVGDINFILADGRWPLSTHNCLAGQGRFAPGL